MSAIDRNDHYEATFAATEKVQPRTLFLQHGQVYQVHGEDVMEPGELVTGHSNRRSEITKGNVTDLFATDADVFYGLDGNAYLTQAAADAASDAVETGSVGFRAGKASKPSSPTQTTVMVLLNL